MTQVSYIGITSTVNMRDQSHLQLHDIVGLYKPRTIHSTPHNTVQYVCVGDSMCVCVGLYVCVCVCVWDSMCLLPVRSLFPVTRPGFRRA